MIDFFVFIQRRKHIDWPPAYFVLVYLFIGKHAICYVFNTIGFWYTYMPRHNSLDAKNYVIKLFFKIDFISVSIISGLNFKF